MNHWPKIQAVLWYVKYHQERTEHARENMRLRLRKLTAEELSISIAVGKQILTGDPNLPEWFPCERKEHWGPRPERALLPGRYSIQTSTTPRTRQYDLSARCACRAGEWQCGGFASRGGEYCSQHSRQQDRDRAIATRTKTTKRFKTIECPKVRMWLDLPDVEPVVPVTEVSEMPMSGGHMLMSEIDAIANGTHSWEPWMRRRRVRHSRRYEGFHKSY